VGVASHSELQRLADEAVLPKELAKFEAWPADCKYNVDEDAANAVKKRDCALMSVNPHADGMGRCFGISADGEKMASHVTDVMCTCCAGTVEAPMVIKTRAGGDNAKEASRKRQLGQEVILPKVTNVDKEGLADESAADEQTLNVCVHTSANGSMTVELFVKWCEHFVDNILKPKGQGPGACTPPRLSSLRVHCRLRLSFSSLCVLGAPCGGGSSGARCVSAGGKPALLFLDGHASRWSVNALFYLRKNNVFVFCVPSHTTIWSQPNDAGPNASFHVRASSRALLYYSSTHSATHPLTPHLLPSPLSPLPPPLSPLPSHLSPLTSHLSNLSPSPHRTQAYLKLVVGREGCAAEACKGGEGFNKVYRAAFIEWRTQLAKDLMQCHYNTITSAWSKVGLGSVLDKGCEMWTASIKSFGGGSMLDTVQQAVFRAQQEHQLQQPGAVGGTEIEQQQAVGGTEIEQQQAVGGTEIEQQDEDEITPLQRLNIEKRDRMLHAVRTLGSGMVLQLARHRTPMVAEQADSSANLLVLAADVRWRRGVLRITPKSDDEEEFQLSKEQVGDTTDAAVVALCSTYELFEQPSAGGGASAQRVKKGNAKLV